MNCMGTETAKGRRFHYFVPLTDSAEDFFILLYFCLRLYNGDSRRVRVTVGGVGEAEDIYRCDGVNLGGEMTAVGGWM